MSKDLCPQGHKFTEDNTYITPAGHAQCKTCRRDRMRERRKDQPRIGQGGKNAAKTHCPQGHEYTEDNTYYRPKKINRHCRTCARVNSREQTIKQYGITVKQFEQMLIQQSGRCFICTEILLDPHIDHDHLCCPGRKACGKCVRALLCKQCNQMLGYARDSITILQAAVNYLQGNTKNRLGELKCQ